MLTCLNRASFTNVVYGGINHLHFNVYVDVITYPCYNSLLPQCNQPHTIFVTDVICLYIYIRHDVKAVHTISARAIFVVITAYKCNRWSLGMDQWFHPTLYWACNYLSMLGLKLIHVSKLGPRSIAVDHCLPLSTQGQLSDNFIRIQFVQLMSYRFHNQW